MPLNTRYEGGLGIFHFLKTEMKLSEKQERWIKQLEKLWNFFDARLNSNSLKSPELRLQILLTQSVAAHRLIIGFLAQLRGGSNDNFESKLRTLMEIVINTHYILGDDTEGRASSYVLNGATSRVNALKKIIELLEQDKANAWAAIHSTESYKELMKEKQQELFDLKACFGVENFSWPNIEQRAKAQGLEELYATIFWYFSEDTHMTSPGLDRFLSNVECGIAFSTNLDLSGLDMEIQTAYSSYLEFINLCSDKLDFPPEEELKVFRNSEMLSIA